MSRKLAIKGHLTRGKEVIEILKMLGGNDDGSWWGNDMDSAYFINDRTQKIDVCTVKTDIVVFTLEEFLEKYPFKVGDKVVDCYGKPLIIKSMEWSEDCETMVYDFKDSVIVLAAEDLLKYNAKQSKMKNVLAELLEHIKTTPKEDLEREFEEIVEWSNVGPTVEEFRTFCECVNKKQIYPKTYEECCNILYITSRTNLCFADSQSTEVDYLYSNKTLLNNLNKLIICRDAYWKIAGEEIGLSKPWEPKSTEMSHAIVCRDDGDFLLHRRTRAILIFPTEEMRDAFYDNFKDLIEQCKELL